MHPSPLTWASSWPRSKALTSTISRKRSTSMLGLVSVGSWSFPAATSWTVDEVYICSLTHLTSHPL